MIRAIAASAACVAFVACVACVACVAGSQNESGPSLYTVEGEQFVRRVTAEGNLRPVEATPITTPPIPGFSRPMKIAWMAEDGSRVAGGDLVVRFDASELEQRLENGLSDHAAASAKLAKERIDGRRSAAQREHSAQLAELELERSRKLTDRDAEIYSRNQIIESEIDERVSVARREHAASAKGIERGLARSKAEIIEVELRRAAQEIAAARAGLEALEIRAPADGLVVFVRDWRGNLPRVGDQVWPGQKIAELPVLDAMEAEVFVLEVDGGGLAEGQSATVVIEAAPERELAGTVKQVDKLAKQRIHDVPVQYFAAVIALETTDPEIMKPGQRVAATLVLDRTDALVVPRQAVFESGGAQVVHRRTAGGFEAVEVELGAASSGRVVVVSGLSAGDRIALTDPGAAASGSGSSGGD